MLPKFKKSKIAKIIISPYIWAEMEKAGFTDQEKDLVRGIWSYSRRAGRLALETIIANKPKGGLR